MPSAAIAVLCVSVLLETKGYAADDARTSVERSSRKRSNP